MNNIKNIVIFGVGALTGAAAAWIYAKKKYEAVAQEEIDSVKEYYSGKNSDKGVDKSNSENVEDTDISMCEKIAAQYTGKGEDEAVSDKPYVISPDEFGTLEDEGYDTITLFYYADQVLADDNNEIIEDVEETVGFESLSHFGEYEEDSVFVRNDERKADYEILIDLRKYSDTVKNRPHRKGI